MRESIGDQVRKGALATGAALLLASSGTSLAAAPSSMPVLMPPPIDYRTVCAKPDRSRPELGIDWTAWDSGATDRSSADLLALASEYLTGSDRVAESPETTTKILDFLAAKRRIGAGIVNFLYGQVHAGRAGDPADLAKAEGYFRKSLKAGYSRSALALGQYYSTGGPIGTRDPVKAARYFRMASAAGDPEGQLGLARLYAADAARTPEEKRFQILNAMVGLAEAIKGGRCSHIREIALLYLRGDLVAQNSAAAVAWLEKAADLGDGAAAEMLGKLLVDPRVERNEFDRSLHYLQIAADEKRPYASFAVGEAFATGIGRDRDLVLAVSYLTTAAGGGMDEAYLWLGRIYGGEFGGMPDPKLAVENYGRAAAAGKLKGDDVASYADLLMASDDDARLDEEAKELQKLAYRGSDAAAYSLARIHLRKAERDGGSYGEAERYLRLAAQNGKSEGARDLARLYYCGAGVPMSAKLGDEWMERAAFLGSSHALYLLAMRERRSAKPDAVAASNRLMLKAANAEAPEAIGFAVSRFETGTDGFRKDAEAARRLIAYAEKLDDAQTRSEAKLEILKGRYETSASPAKRAAILEDIGLLATGGLVSAMLLRAELLDDSGVASPAEVRDAYRMAAENGDPRGMREYGMRLLATSSDEAPEARDWIRKAAGKGDVPARIALVDLAAPDAAEKLDTVAASGMVCTGKQMTKLARAYRRIGTAAAESRAATWAERAAAMGDPNAVLELAAAHEVEVERNRRKTDLRWTNAGKRAIGRRS